MADATITLKLSVGEFDMIRRELAQRVGDLEKERKDAHTAGMRREMMEKQAELADLLGRLNA